MWSGWRIPTAIKKPMCGGVSPQLILGCRWYALDTLCKYTIRIMWSLKQSSRCYWLAVCCNGRATVVEVGWWRCCLEDCWECCSSLRLARWVVLFGEARWSQRVDLAASHLSLRQPAPVAGYIATYRACHACKTPSKHADWSDSSSWLSEPNWSVFP
jgi:hypothetical protein